MVFRSANWGFQPRTDLALSEEATSWAGSPARRGQILPPPQVPLPAQQPLLPAAALCGAPGQTAGVLPQLQPGDGEGRLPCQQQRPQQPCPGS